MPPAFEIVENLTQAEIGSFWRALEAGAAPPFFLSWDWIGGWIETANIRSRERDGVMNIRKSV